MADYPINAITPLIAINALKPLERDGKAVAVEWLDSALQGENLADEIAQIRQGSHTVAEFLSQKAPEIAIESDRPFAK